MSVDKQLKSANSPIGIFDSGIGGLSVLKEIAKLLPNENLIYLGDTAHTPYGSRSPSDIIRLSLESLSFLQRHQIKALVPACNTICSVAFKQLSETSHLPIVNIIGSTATEATKTQGQRIVVMGTTTTIKSFAYFRAIKRQDKTAAVHGRACPSLVELTEQGITEGQEAQDEITKSLPLEPTDTLILGCTHYSLLTETIIRIKQLDTKLLDPAWVIARELQYQLAKKHLLNEGSGGKRRCYFTSKHHMAEKTLWKLDLQVDSIETTKL